MKGRSNGEARVSTLDAGAIVRNVHRNHVGAWLARSAVAVALVGLTACTDNPDAAPDDGAEEPKLLEVGSIPPEGRFDQQAALADGEVSDAEISEALRALTTCLDGQGFPASIDEGRQSRSEVRPEDLGLPDTAEASEAFIICRTATIAHLELRHLAQNPSSAVDAGRAARVEQCLEATGGSDNLDLPALALCLAPTG